MKRSLMAALISAPIVLLLHSASLAQSSNLIVLSKNVSGRIFRSSLALTLSSNVDCDKTQSLIPDGSRLVSDSFDLNTDSAGVGTFSGFARIVAPDEKVVLQGWLRGTAGVNTRRDPTNKDCHAPGRLEGIFEGAPARSIKRSNVEAKSQVIILNFTAEPDPRIAGPIAIYRGWLDGLITAPSPVEEKVKIAPDKSGYLPTDVITAIIFNGSDQTIRALDQQSKCTIIQLQVQEDGRWTDVAICPLDRAPIPTNIFPNQKIEVALNPLQPPPANPPGLYRLGLTFKVVENGNPVGNSLFVASEPFRIIAPPSSDRVSVMTERSEYDVSETIVARVANGNDRSIVTWDHQSNCTILTMEKQELNGWVAVAPCPLLSPVLPEKIGPRMEVLVRLTPGSFNNRFDPGTYRLRFFWQFVGDNGQPAGNIMTTYSPQFTLTPKR